MKTTAIEAAMQKVNDAIEELNALMHEGPDESMQGMIHLSNTGETVRVICSGRIELMAAMLYSACLGDEHFTTALFEAANGLTDNQ